MKKILLAVVFALGAVAPGTVLAVAGPFKATNINVEAGVGNDCALLSEDVVLGVSAHVWGHYTCDEVNNIIRVGACHEGGHRGPIVCAWVDDDGDPLTAMVVNSQNCSTTQADDGATSDVPAFKSFGIASTGGSTVEYEMDGRCTDAELTGTDFWQ